MQSDSSGKLTISDPDKFISGLGLSDAYAERLMSQGIDFSDFDEFKQFIDTAADSGNTTKEPGFYADIFSDEANLSSDASIQKSSAVRSDESAKAADKAFNIKPNAKAPAPAQAQANRPTLDNPDNGTSAFATNAYLQMPDYLPRPGSNTKMPNRQKKALITEANRRQRKEIQEQIAREKKEKTRSLEDQRLATINDQYRDIFANSSKDRSAEDWDAMSRDQKVKLIKNYNLNMGSKSMEKPEGEVTKTGTVGQAFEAPKPGLEDLTTPSDGQARMANIERELDLPEGQSLSWTAKEIARRDAENRGVEFDQNKFYNTLRDLSLPAGPEQSPSWMANEVAKRTAKNSPAPTPAPAPDNTPERRRKPVIPADAVHTRNPNVPSDSHSGIYATNPGVQKRAFDTQLDHAVRNTIPYENNIDDSKSTKVTPPPGVTVQPEPEGDILGSLTPAVNQAVNVSKNFFNDLTVDKPAPQAPTTQVPATQAPAPQAPAAKLPSADPFLDDEPAEMQGPSERMIKDYKSDGSFTMIPYSEARRRAQKYAKNQMKNSPRSLLGDTYSDDMSRLYPTLNTGGIKREIDQENADRFSRNNPFGSKFRPASRDYLGPVAKAPTPRTDQMMSNINAMPKRQQLNVINSFRRHRGEDEIYNPFA